MEIDSNISVTTVNISKNHDSNRTDQTLFRYEHHDCAVGAEIGQGEFGSVVKGTYKRNSGKKKDKIDVAIKLFHKTAINNQEDFLKEARTMQQLEHECIVNFLGIAESDSHELMLVRV